MAFKKIHPDLLLQLHKHGIEAPFPLQKKAISALKSGTDFFLIGDKGSGKTEALIIGVLHRLNMKAAGDNPRVVIFAKDKKAVNELYELFARYTADTDLRIHAIYEERRLDDQKNEVYMGADLVIGTPKRLSKLYFLNGLNLMELQTLVVEDAEFLTGTSFHTEIQRLVQSVGRCQCMVIAEKLDTKIERLRPLIMENARVIIEE